MAETTITEQIVREAPEIEALKLGLIQSAKGLADTSIQLPVYSNVQPQVQSRQVASEVTNST